MAAAGRLLEQLAAAAERQPAPAGAGRYDYVRTRGAADLEVVGPVVDRVGRAGVGVAAAAAGFRRVAVLDPATGTLLALERVALEPARDLPGPPPVPVSHTAYLGSGRVPDTGTRPA